MMKYKNIKRRLLSVIAIWGTIYYGWSIGYDYIQMFFQLSGGNNGRAKLSGWRLSQVGSSDVILGYAMEFSDRDTLIIPIHVWELDDLHWVTMIGDSALKNCVMKKVHCPLTLESIGHSAFKNCEDLSEIFIQNPDNITFIGDSAFLNCSSLRSFVFPNSITIIRAGTFSGCSSMTQINIPNSIISIGNYAFSGCDALTNISIPISVISIGQSAFYGCNGLTGELTMPESVKIIGDYAFYDCCSLTSVTIPSSITAIGDEAFVGCIALDTLNYNAISCKDFNYGPSSPFYNLNISTINIGDNVQKVPANFAYQLEKLVCINIPNSVTEIGDYAFYNCKGLTSLFLSGQDIDIAQLSFAECRNLKSIYCQSIDPPRCSYDAFSGLDYASCRLYVPKGCVERYAEAFPWSLFNIIDSGCDVDGDGEVSIADVSELIDSILSGEPNSNSDINNDGMVNIADIADLIDIIIKG